MNCSKSIEERKRYLITHIMHEFGHALESHFRLPVNEDAIEAACRAWESAWDKTPVTWKSARGGESFSCEIAGLFYRINRNWRNKMWYISASGPEECARNFIPSNEQADVRRHRTK